MGFEGEGKNPEAMKLRRKAAVIAASSASLSAASVALTHGHPYVAGGMLLVQLSLLAISISMFVRSKRMGND